MRLGPRGVARGRALRCPSDCAWTSGRGQRPLPARTWGTTQPTCSFGPGRTRAHRQHQSSPSFSLQLHPPPCPPKASMSRAERRHVPSPGLPLPPAPSPTRAAPTRAVLPKSSHHVHPPAPSPTSVRQASRPIRRGPSHTLSSLAVPTGVSPLGPRTPAPHSPPRPGLPGCSPQGTPLPAAHCPSGSSVLLPTARPRPQEHRTPAAPRGDPTLPRLLLGLPLVPRPHLCPPLPAAPQLPRLTDRGCRKHDPAASSSCGQAQAIPRGERHAPPREPHWACSGASWGPHSPTPSSLTPPP